MNKFIVYHEIPERPLTVRIEVKFGFLAICPIPAIPKPYGGEITVSYTPKVEGDKLRLLEWDAFDRWIKTLQSETQSAEKMAHIVMCKFLEAIDPEDATLYMEVSVPLHLPVNITLKYKAKR